MNVWGWHVYGKSADLVFSLSIRLIATTDVRCRCQAIQAAAARWNWMNVCDQLEASYITTDDDASEEVQKSVTKAIHRGILFDKAGADVLMKNRKPLKQLWNSMHREIILIEQIFCSGFCSIELLLVFSLSLIHQAVKCIPSPDWNGERQKAALKGISRRIDIAKAPFMNAKLLQYCPIVRSLTIESRFDSRILKFSI